ncbi:hypothetical protein bcgnr5390_57970 [Bacillus luti]
MSANKPTTNIAVATFENTKHALGLADHHIVIALSTLSEVENKLGISQK